MNVLTELTVLFKDFLWGFLVSTLMFIAGCYITWQIRGLQFRRLWLALKLIFSTQSSNDTEKTSTGDLSTFEAVMTGLAGAIGTGNITGIATAMAMGGIGSLFWLWVMAALGMATAYAETLLNNKYRKVNANNEIAGGPMFLLADRLKSPKLAIFFALATIGGSLGLGCTAQTNGIIDAVTFIFPLERIWLGLILAAIVGSVVIGGIKIIGRFAAILVPLMAIIYLIICLWVIGGNIAQIPAAFSLILASAWKGQSAVGGFLGASVWLAIQNGVQYGVFATEAGLGSLAIAGSTAKTTHPAEQAMRSLGGVFIAAMLVCTLTGLVLVTSGVQGTLTPNGDLLRGSALAMAAFANTNASLQYPVMIGLVLFAFTTMLAWAYYGEKSIEFLFSAKYAKFYRLFFTFMVIPGAIFGLDLIWAFSHIANGLMSIPNLISVLLLSSEVKQDTQIYEQQLKI